MNSNRYGDVDVTERNYIKAKLECKKILANYNRADIFHGLTQDLLRLKDKIAPLRKKTKLFEYLNRKVFGRFVSDFLEDVRLNPGAASSYSVIQPSILESLRHIQREEHRDADIAKKFKKDEESIQKSISGKGGRPRIDMYGRTLPTSSDEPEDEGYSPFERGVSLSPEDDMIAEIEGRDENEKAEWSQEWAERLGK